MRANRRLSAFLIATVDKFASLPWVGESGALLGGARNPDNPADPYPTVLGYFNSLRELGGTLRILEEIASAHQEPAP